MLTPKLVKQLTIREPQVDDVIPAQRSAEADAGGFYPPMLFGLQVTGHATNAPTVNDDESTGHVAPMFWVRSSPFEIYLATNVDEGAAKWTNITAQASITGLTNPLVSGLNAAGHLIYAAAFAGFRDRYYDLVADPNNLVSGGVASLNSVYNAWEYAALDSPLAIRLPNPADVSSADALFGIVSVRLADGGSVTIDDTYPWGWEKANPSDPDPALETAEHTHLRLRYQYDPVAERYSVFAAYLTYDPPAPEIEKVVMVPDSFTTHAPAVNANSVSHTHTFTSTEQDGHLALLVVVAADSDSSKPITSDVYPDGLIEHAVSASLWNNAIWVGYMFPTPQQLADGSFPMTWTQTNEACQIMAIELHGVDPLAPFTEAEDLSISSTTSIGPATVTTERPNSLVISACMTDESRTLTIAAANGNTQVYLGGPNSSRGGHSLHIREVEAVGSYDSPQYTGSTADRMNVIAFAAQPPEA